MPELPEVETVKNGLEQIISLPAQISALQTSSKQLRFPYPSEMRQRLVGKSILGFERRAKYLIFDLGDENLICHLGMTGNWRKGADFNAKSHDHLRIEFDGDLSLIYNDVRRFGYFDLIPAGQLESSRWFKGLGPEPVGENALTAKGLSESLEGRSASIKSLLMNQAIVVGVGNIYASESLFKAGIRPDKKANQLSAAEVKTLVRCVRQVISSAIKSGGTTIRDFKNAGGSEGYFQTQLLVYGRKGAPCDKCGSKIKSSVIVGRSTFWCPKCQK